MAQVAQLIHEAISTGRFIGSEWCEQEPVGPIAPCDAYEVTRSKGKHKKLYVKFAISRRGMTVLTISCHPSTRKRP